MNIDKISKLIKSKRKEKGLTQEELAIKLNVTEKAISRWETGRGTPDISLLIPLSKELNVSVSELLNGKENKKEEQNIKELINYIDITNKNKNKYIIPISVIIYFVTLLCYLFYLKMEYNPNNTFGFTFIGEIVYFCIFGFVISLTNSMLSNYYYDKLEDKDKMKKITYIILLILYTITFINLTILGRKLIGVNSYNLVPFKTLIGYWAFFDSRTFLINVIGNIVILMPMEYLILKIFNIKRFSVNLLISFIISATIEIMQYITHIGVLDIDDILLNVLGMSIMFKLFDIFINKKKMNTELHQIIIAILSLFILFFLFQILSWYNFGDIPTISVLIRLIICYIIIYFINSRLYSFIKKRK